MEKLIKLQNGIKLALIQNLGMRSVSTGVWVESGSSFETPDINGISHFIEHTLFKGTTKRTSFEISDCIDRVGGQMNAFTSKEATCFYTKTTSEYLDLSLDFLSDLILNATFDENELNKERGVILEEISMVEDTPDDLVMDLLSKAYFEKSPLGQTILGKRENIKKITKADVKKYMAKNYAPNNVVVSIAGNFDETQAITLVNKYFVEPFNASEVALPKIERYLGESAFEFKEKDIEQCHIAFAFPSETYASKNLYKSQILNVVLGGGMSSRLFQNIREQKGLAYTVYSYNSTYKNNGTNVIYAGVNPKNVSVATKAIQEEILKLKKDKITQEEFNRGKAQMIGSFVFAQENTSTLMSTYGKRALFLGELFSIDDRLEEIRNISYDEVCALIDSSFDLNKVSAAMVGKSECDILSEIRK